ncbi:MAG: hypothetical protein ACRD0A_11815 [Acidimicrobiales bacterium]
MLGFEREVVRALAAGVDARQRAAIDAWVSGSLADMPELLRAGVAAESAVLGAWWRIGRRRRDLAGFVTGLSRSRIGPLRQYARLFRSLVLFAELEPQR